MNFKSKFLSIRDKYDPKIQTYCSLDVVSMYNNIDVDAVKKFILNKIYASPKKYFEIFQDGEGKPLKFPPRKIFSQILDAGITDFTQFECKLGFFEQTRGVSMGGKLSPIIDNIYASITENALVSENIKSGNILLFSRFVDDCFCIVRKDFKLKLFHEINKRSESLKYTIEHISENKLSFLDTEIFYDGTSQKLEMRHFQKNTKSDCTINFIKSCAPKSQKMAAISGEVHRIINSTTQEKNLKKDFQKMTSKYLNNGFPKKLIVDKISHVQKHQKRTPSEPETTFFFSAYFTHERLNKIGKQMSKTIKNATPNFHLIPSWKCIRLKSITSKTLKAPPIVDNPSGIIYKFECPCDLTYIGESKRNFKTRILEHQRPSLKSSVKDHVNKCQPYISQLHTVLGRFPKSSARREHFMSHFSILRKNVHNWHSRTLQEGILISLYEPRLNDQIVHRKVTML
jgi:hypothetical protein